MLAQLTSRARLSLLAFILSALGALGLLAVRGWPAPAQRMGVKAPATNQADYAGGEECAACHAEVAEAFKKNSHYKTWNDTQLDWSQRGCEACHGPGREHIEAGGDISKIFNYKKVSAQKVSDECLSCHLQQEERSNFLRSEHGLNSVACTECHSVHTPKARSALLKSAQPALCYSCHGEVKPEFNKPFHHREKEGLMSCSDCHNQHGGFNVRQTREATGTDLVCYTCHADKQGPFVFEHAPVKVEGCTICHSPHGSQNPRMLKRAQQHLLCLECHSNLPGGAPGTPTFHNIATARFRNCTTCHVNIHGSNLNKFFFE